jgi:hypothetical protein
MRYCRHFAACVTGLTLGLLAATAGPAAASVEGPKAVTTWAAAVSPGTPTWIELFWTTGKKLCHVQVTVAAANVDVVYPTNTGDYSSLSQSSTLRAYHIDETSVRITANYPTTAWVPLKATMSFDYCAPNPVPKTESFTITLPVLDRG